MRHALTVVAVLALLAAACGQDPALVAPEDDEAPGAAEPAPEESPEEEPGPAAPLPGYGPEPDTDDDPVVREPSGPVLAVAGSGLGEILVGPDGMTLYLFLNDEENVSTCAGGCRTTWPPLLAEDVDGADGVDRALLGTTTSTPDGQSQATYNGWPLYYYAGDHEAGDTNGQGVGDVWFAVSPDGELAG